MVELSNKCIWLVGRGFLATYLGKFYIFDIVSPRQGILFGDFFDHLTMKVAATSTTRLNVFLWLGVIGQAG